MEDLDNAVNEELVNYKAKLDGQEQSLATVKKRLVDGKYLQQVKKIFSHVIHHIFFLHFSQPSDL